jgi:glycosyltransferase involved in cell wall biosynthesis
MSLKKTKVLHVVNVSFVLPYFIGDQFVYLAKKGFEFYVGCTPSEHLYKLSKELEFEVVEINVVREINIVEDIRSIIILYKYIKKYKIDIVIGHTPKGGMAAMIAAFMAGVKKRIYFRHGIMYETSRGLRKIMLKNIEKFTGALATQVVCVSRSVLELSNHSKLSKSSKNLILGHGTCNGINVEKFSRSSPSITPIPHEKKAGEYIVGYVGRLVKDKGIEELIAAWKIVMASFPNARLLIVGPFEKRDIVSDDTIDFIKTAPSIIFTDLVEDTKPYYQMMDLLILPSYREGFPTVVLEASAMELPVITTRSTGCLDSIVENETGIYTNIDAEDIAAKICYYISHPETGKKHGYNGRKFVTNNFKQKSIWDEIEKDILSNRT